MRLIAARRQTRNGLASTGCHLPKTENLNEMFSFLCVEVHECLVVLEKYAHLNKEKNHPNQALAHRETVPDQRLVSVSL